jgi:hypothetical protein
VALRGVEKIMSKGEGIDDASAVRAMIVHIVRLSLISISVVIPLSLCLPGNVCTHAAGNVKMISDGFRAHSSLSTVVWGSALCWVTSLRVHALLSRGSYNKTLAQVALVLSTPASFVTIRYDEVENVHVWAAAVWIMGSLVYHYAVMRGVYDDFMPVLRWVVFGCTVLCGAVFLGMFIGVHSSDVVQNRDVLSGIAVLEILTVYGVLLCDFLLSSFLLYKENDGDGIFEVLVWHAGFTEIASMLTLGVLWVLVFVLIFLYFLAL